MSHFATSFLYAFCGLVQIAVPDNTATTLRCFGLIHGLISLFDKMSGGAMLRVAYHNANTGRGLYIVLYMHLGKGSKNFFSLLEHRLFIIKKLQNEDELVSTIAALNIIQTSVMA